VSKKFERTRGRKVGGTFLLLPRAVLESEQWAALPDCAVRLVTALGAQFNGNNNGDQSAAWTLMRERGFVSKATLNKATKALVEAGFITVTRQGGRRRTTLFAYTWLPINECDGKLDVQATRVASNAWQQIPPLPRHWSPTPRPRKNRSGAPRRELTAPRRGAKQERLPRE